MDPYESWSEPRRLQERCAIVVLGSVLLASLVGLWSWGPVSIEQAGERWQQINSPAWRPMVWAAGLNLWGVVAACWGVRLAARRDRGQGQAWWAFFGVTALSQVAAGLQHVHPDAVTHLTGELLLASAVALATLLFVAERLHHRDLSARELAPVVMAGPLAAVLGAFCGSSLGAPDLRWIWWLQALPVLLLPLAVWPLRSRGLDGRVWLVALAIYVPTQLAACLGNMLLPGLVFEAVDPAYGHVAQSAGLAMTLSWLALSLRRQSKLRARSSASAVTGAAGVEGLLSQRSTS